MCVASTTRGDVPLAVERSVLSAVLRSPGSEGGLGRGLQTVCYVLGGDIAGSGDSNELLDKEIFFVLRSCH